MQAEIEPQSHKKYKGVPIIAKTLAAAGIAFYAPQGYLEDSTVPSVSQAGQEQSSRLEEEVSRLHRLEDSTSQLTTEGKSQKKTDKNEQFTQILKNPNVRKLLGAAFVFSLASTASAYRLGNKYDEKKLQLLRTGGPLLLTASIAGLELNSITTIDRHIPVSLFTASTFLNAAYNVVNTFERERDPKTRAIASGTSAALCAVGLTALLAVDKF